jgi:predicted dehydrogenase
MAEKIRLGSSALTSRRIGRRARTCPRCSPGRISRSLQCARRSRKPPRRRDRSMARDSPSTIIERWWPPSTSMQSQWSCEFPCTTSRPRPRCSQASTFTPNGRWANHRRGRGTRRARTAEGRADRRGLQSRVSPPLCYMKALIDEGYVGEVMACHVSLLRDGVLARTASRTWQHDASLGANTLTIANGHTIDALRFVAGNFSHVAAVVATQAKQWLETDTKRMVDVTSPDNIIVSGRMINGAVVSSHVAAVPWAASGFRMEVYGRKGTLVATSDDSPQLGEITLQGAQGSNQLAPIEVPARFVLVPAATPRGDPYNVGQMYCEFGRAIRDGGGQTARLRHGGRSAPLHRCDQALVGHRRADRACLSRYAAASIRRRAPRYRGKRSWVVSIVRGQAYES